MKNWFEKLSRNNKLLSVLMVVLGLVLIVILRAGLKKLFGLISDGLYWNALRYCAMVTFAGAVWPRTFKFWAKVGAKRK